MEVRPLEPSEAGLVAQWLASEDIAKWLDLGDGGTVSPLGLKIMMKKESNVFWTYTADDSDAPIGLVALSGINRKHQSAMFWAFMGEQGLVSRGYTSRASRKLLRHAFEVLGLRSVHAWVAEVNHPCLRMVSKLGFREMGRQRDCHLLDGRYVDRLWFDIVAAELREQNGEIGCTAADWIVMAGQTDAIHSLDCQRYSDGS